MDENEMTISEIVERLRRMNTTVPLNDPEDYDALTQAADCLEKLTEITAEINKRRQQPGTKLRWHQYEWGY